MRMLVDADRVNRINLRFGVEWTFILSALTRSFGRRVQVRTNNSGLESVMAQVCEVCGKGPQFGNKISHAHNVSRRRWSVNLRPVKAKVGGGARKLRACTSCIKSGKVTKA
jgi:large subunit ribosomal protein L28